MSNEKAIVILLNITETKKEKARTDGKISREYYTAEFSDPSNPFAKTVRRNFWQQHTPDGKVVAWRGANPRDVKAFINKPIPGEIMAEEVVPYQIDGLPGEQPRMANTYTTVVLGNEMKNQVFRSLGHPLKSDENLAADAIIAPLSVEATKEAVTRKNEFVNGK